MKKTVFPLLLFLAAFALSCNDDAPAQKKTFRPVRMEEVSYKRELIYNPSGQVIEVVSESQMPDKDVITTVQEFEYNGEGKIVSSNLDYKRHYQYTWKNDKIVKTEEFENGVPLNRFTFSYHSNGLIKEMLTYKYENGSATQVGKVTYAFDPSGNISSVKEFSFKDSAYSLESIHEYDRYDNMPSVDSHFGFHTLNTGMQLHKNNPGRMVSRNKNGIAFSIEDYVYEYDVNGFVKKRESTITFLHIGSTGSYETHYFFEPL
ncbi:MAG TPA: hypothetical protein VGD40_18020 [Chryseosolibacter sp.]